jgi:hypothetical protein
MTRHALFVLIPLMLFGANARADGDPPAPAGVQQAASPVDVIVLKDGRRLEGEVVGEDDRAVSLKSGGVTRTYTKDSIASVEKAPRAAASSDPAGQPGAAPTTPPAPTEPAKGKKGNKGERRDAPLSDAAKKWLDELLAKTADASDDAVRRSVSQAIQALGPSAIPALRAAQAAAPDGPQKQFLDRLASDMEQRRDRRGDGMGPEGRPAQARRGLEEMMQRLSSELELKDEQKPKVEAIVQDWGKKRFEIQGAARREGLSQEQVQEKVAALRTDVLAQMKAVLTEPQYALFEQEANRMFEAQRGPMPPAPKPPAKPGDGEQPMPPEKPLEPAK